MATSQLSLYNGALRECSERKLASLTEARGPRYLLDDVWADDPIKDWLEEANWNFAIDTQVIDYDPGIDPEFGFKKVFPLPANFVRMASLAEDEYFTEPMTNFRIENGYIFADVEQIYMSFVSDAADFGRDFSLWPGYFSRYGEADLARRINPRLTNQRVKTLDLDELVKKRCSEAQSKDGCSRPTLFKPRGSWVRSRHGAHLRDKRRRP